MTMNPKDVTAADEDLGQLPDAPLAMPKQVLEGTGLLVLITQFFGRPETSRRSPGR